MPSPALRILGVILATGLAQAGDGLPPLRRTVASGQWSDPKVWEGGIAPKPGDRVQIRTGHAISYDLQTDKPFRSIHVAGRLGFVPSKTTRLDVGLIKIQAGDDASESGAGCEAHAMRPAPHAERPALEVGTPEHPISPDHTATIRLWAVPGLDPEETPAIVCCGGRMDLHGTPMSRTWVKLGKTAAKGVASIDLAEPVPGWKPGDRVIVTATLRQVVLDKGDVPSLKARAQTEERTVVAIHGTTLTVDRPLRFQHLGEGDFRGEVANLSRNVVIESAAPAIDSKRGHTMYHRHSAGSISYAEFRHLGKPGKLGKYSLHFHRVRDTMRGSSVVGASIWDSGNRWITVHGTDFLVIRDCVGYQSRGHGFFLEDATETGNLLDRNLAVQSLNGQPLPDQVLPFDRNEGAGFWWANQGNAFTRNVAAECDQYGFRYDFQADGGFDPAIAMPDGAGGMLTRDVRTVPLLRFEGNESHAQRRYGVNLGGGPGDGAKGGVGGVGPDDAHPSLVRGLKVWDAHWALTAATPGLLLDDVTLAETDFALWRPRYDRQSHRDVKLVRAVWPASDEQGTVPDSRAYPRPLTPRDDRPPVAIVLGRRGTTLHGVAFDDGAIRSVVADGREARLTRIQPGLVDWEIEHAGPSDLVAVKAVDGRP